MPMFEFLQAFSIIAIIIVIALIVIMIKLIIAIFRIRDNTERTALVLEAIAKANNIPLPKEYTDNFKNNHYNVTDFYDNIS